MFFFTTLPLYLCVCVCVCVVRRFEQIIQKTNKQKNNTNNKENTPEREILKKSERQITERPSHEKCQSKVTFWTSVRFVPVLLLLRTSFGNDYPNGVIHADKADIRNFLCCMSTRVRLPAIQARVLKGLLRRVW